MDSGILTALLSCEKIDSGIINTLIGGGLGIIGVLLGWKLSNSGGLKCYPIDYKSYKCLKEIAYKNEQNINNEIYYNYIFSVCMIMSNNSNSVKAVYNPYLKFETENYNGKNQDLSAFRLKVQPKNQEIAPLSSIEQQFEFQYELKNKIEEISIKNIKFCYTDEKNREKKVLIKKNRGNS